MRVVTKTAEAKIVRFSLYTTDQLFACILSLTTKLKGIPFEFQAQFLIDLRPLKWRLGYALFAARCHSVREL